MNTQFARMSFRLSTFCAFTALLFTGTFALAQVPPMEGIYRLNWAGQFNNSALGGEIEDSWVANSFTAVFGYTHIVAISLPIGDDFSNQAISGLIYKGFDIHDPTAGGGLVLLSETDTTFSSTVGDVITITLNTPVDFKAGDVFYAAVLIPGVPGYAPGISNGKFPFYEDDPLDPPSPKALGRSFYDVGLTLSGPYDVNQGSANITVLGATHPIVGSGVQDPGNLALWVHATASR
jgi:hypothetical protein